MPNDTQSLMVSRGEVFLPARCGAVSSSPPNRPTKKFELSALKGADLTVSSPRNEET
jgi:hypothetical protein